MHELRIHGRGGQGAVLAASILAAALVAEGQYAVAVPSFGFERRGAPVAAFLRFDRGLIRAMTNIYTPDVVLCIDPTVARSVNVFAGLKPGGTLVQTTHLAPEALAVPAEVGMVGACDAVAIALAIFRRPITNTVMLGAYARTTGHVSIESLRRALAESDFRDAGLAQNLEALEQGYASTRVRRVGSAVAA